MGCLLSLHPGESSGILLLGSERSKWGVRWDCWWQWPLLFLCCVFSFGETSMEIPKPSLPHYSPREEKKGIGNPGLKQTEWWSELKWGSLWFTESLNFLVLCSVLTRIKLLGSVSIPSVCSSVLYRGSGQNKAIGGGAGIIEKSIRYCRILCIFCMAGLRRYYRKYRRLPWFYIILFKGLILYSHIDMFMAQSVTTLGLCFNMLYPSFHLFPGYIQKDDYFK